MRATVRAWHPANVTAPSSYRRWMTCAARNRPVARRSGRQNLQAPFGGPVEPCVVIMSVEHVAYDLKSFSQQGDCLFLVDIRTPLVRVGICESAFLWIWAAPM